MDKLPDLWIREMNREDLTFAASCTAAEGWLSEDLTTLEGFYLHDPKSCLLAEVNCQPVGTCVATSYDKCGFIGELIVLPEFRGLGIGARLLNHGIQLLQERGAESIYLDGVLKAVGLYERCGFHKVTRSWRFTGSIPGRLSSHVRQMTADDLDQVIALDKSSFGADRSFFLRRRASLFPHLSHVMLEDDTLIGFIMGRCGAGWISAGPWVMSATAKNPAALLYAFSHASGDQYFSIGVLDVNQRVVDLLRSLGFMGLADSPWRMALGLRDDLGMSDSCYAVGSAAKG